MSAKTSPRPETVEPLEQGTPNTEPTSAASAAFNWDTLKAPIVAPSAVKATPTPSDVIASTPEGIRKAVEKLLAVNILRETAAAKSTAQRPRIDYVWNLQEVPDKDTAEQFIKKVRRYCKGRPMSHTIPHKEVVSPAGEITARFSGTQHYRPTDDGAVEECEATDPKAMLCVRYSVRKFQARSDSKKS